jgi:hypothetical protein
LGSRYGGAIGDVPDDDTAFSRRDTQFEFIARAGWADPEEDEARIARPTMCARDRTIRTVGPTRVIGEEPSME